jgi:hypothetical protein
MEGQGGGEAQGVADPKKPILTYPNLSGVFTGCRKGAGTLFLYLRATGETKKNLSGVG